MKRISLLFVVFLTVTVYVSAQDTTWTNPLSERTDTVPHSMINAVTNGTVYDGIDIILTSPSELSDFEGVSIYTGFGNYESWANYPKDDTEGPVTAMNPFTGDGTFGLSGLFDAASAGGNVAFQLGYMLPIMKMQSGIIGGFQFGQSNNLTGYFTTPAGHVTESITDIVDTIGVIGTADSSSSESFDYYNTTVNHHFRIGAGIDLGFMGASLRFTANDVSTVLGGTYDFSWVTGEIDPTGTERTTSKSIRYGYGYDGAAAVHGTPDNNWQIEALGQLPLNIIGISMPVTASVRFGMESDGVSANAIPMAVTVRDSYVDTDGAAGTINDVSTLSYTIGIADINQATTSGEQVTLGDNTSATYGIATGLMGSTEADAKDVKDGTVSFGISGRVDPKIKISDVLTARTRAQADFDMGFHNNNNTGTRSIDFSRADSGATNSTWSYRYKSDDPDEAIEMDMSFELGGILEAKSANGRLTVSSGFFYNPEIDLNTTFNNPTVVTESESSYDTTGATPEVNGTNVFGDIGLGGAAAQGTQTRTTTTTYTGPDVSNVITHNFIIPVSAKVDVVKDKLSLIGGYVLNSSVTSTYTETGVLKGTDIVDKFTNSSGVDVSPATGGATSVDDTATSQKATSITETLWTGQLNFMIRWKPIENLTVDFFGQSIVNAIDFTIFGSDTAAAPDDGFNPKRIIDSLGMSVTFSF